MSIGQILVDKFGHDGWHVDKDLKLAIYDIKLLLHICNVYLTGFYRVSVTLTRDIDSNSVRLSVRSSVRDVPIYQTKAA